MNVKLPKSVSAIGNVAFGYCNSLTNITLPIGIKYIGESMFLDCVSLKEITIPEGVTDIRARAFEGCSVLEKVTFPTGVANIGNSAFGGCKALKEVVLPEGLKHISEYAFVDCISLRKITIPEGVVYIGGDAFNGCSALQEITIPEGVDTIHMNTFHNCSSLQKISLPAGLTYIGEWAFGRCSALKKVTLPLEITTINKMAFAYCSSLQEIEIPEGVKTIDIFAFSGCNALNIIRLSRGVTTIRYNAFDNCNSIKEIVIPDSVTKIEEDAFKECSSLVQIFIPDNSISGNGISIEDGAIPDMASEIKYVINEKGSVTITNIKIGDGQTLVQIHDMLTEYPVMSVAKEFRHLVSEEGHTHRYDNQGICQICDKRRSGHHHTGDDMRPPHDIPKGPDTWKDKEGIDAFVYRLYNIALIRDGDKEGLEDWIDRLDTKKESAAEVAWGFFFSDEFLNKNYTDEQYIELLYLTMFGRESDGAGKRYWLECLENGVSREYIYRGFAESPEFTGLCGDFGVERGFVDLNQYRDQNIEATGFIARLYTQMLGRSFDDDGIEYWCQEYLGEDSSIEEIAADGFLHSTEFKNQNLSNREFVIRMYRTFLNREPDEEGLADWVNRLETGRETRDSLVYGFTRSKEFGNFKEAYGL